MSQEDNTLKLQAKLDQAKSRQNINADIQTLQKQIDPVRLQVDVDSSAGSKVKSLLTTIREAFDSLRSTISGVKLFSELQNIGKRRASVRISDIGYCFEYALHAQAA